MSNIAQLYTMREWIHKQLVCMCFTFYTATLMLLALQDQTDGGSKEKLLKKWNGQKLMRNSAWDKLKTSICLIDCPEWTGTGCIGEKDGKVYLVTCRHNLEEDSDDSAEDILKRAQESKLKFCYNDRKAGPVWSLKGSDLLQNQMPIGDKVCSKHTIVYKPLLTT